MGCYSLDFLTCFNRGCLTTPGTLFQNTTIVVTIHALPNKQRHSHLLCSFWGGCFVLANIKQMRIVHDRQQNRTRFTKHHAPFGCWGGVSFSCPNPKSASYSETQSHTFAGAACVLFRLMPTTRHQSLKGISRVCNSNLNSTNTVNTCPGFSSGVFMFTLQTTVQHGLS